MSSESPSRQSSDSMSGFSMPSASGISTAGGAGGRERFATDELAIVLSHYDVGVIEALQEYPRGSRKAPKIVFRTDKGMYLLKRRARGKDDAFKVAFCHELQLFLASRQFPLPHLIGTRSDNNSMLHWKGGIYELFEYIKGTSYDSSLEATADAGATLALFHKLTLDYRPEYEPPMGSYHAARSVAASFDVIPRTLAGQDAAPDVKQAGPIVQFLHQSYGEAAQRANELGLPDWPAQIVHSDWHTGNMLFRGPRVIAVIDYDAARLGPRVTDVANGALQFSIIGGGDDPDQWPDHIDESRYKRFLRGYDEKQVLSRAELRAVPWLMIEALVAECVIPIAATGSIGKMQGTSFLPVVARKVKWLQRHADALASVLEA